MRLYRWLLRVYPAPFRHLYGAELEALFARLLERARPEGRVAVARLWGRTAIDTLRTGLRERWSRRGYRVGRSRLRVPRRSVASRLADLAWDLRVGARSLLRSPGYCVAVVLTLALGIGANTALFSVAYGTLIRPLPFADADRLVRLVHEAPSAADPEGGLAREGFSVADLQAYAAGLPAVEDLAEFHAMSFTLIDSAGPHRVRAGVVSAGFFDLLGTEALHGRLLSPADDAMEAEPVVVLSHRYWMDRFGGDPDVIGMRVRMNDHDHRVVGVLPARPWFPVERDLFLPVSACPTRSDPAFIADARARMMFAYARMAPGATVAEVGAGADSLLAALASADPETWPVDRGFDVRAVSLHDDMVAEVRPLAGALFAVAGFLLLIACANAAGLSLARAGRRLRELEVRGALGAGRARLLRTLVGEGVILALVGGALGVGVAVGGHDLLVGFAERFTTRAQEIRLDGAVLAFTAVASIASGLVFGAVPGFWVAGRVGSRGVVESSATVGRGSRSLQQGLVVGQVAVAFAVVTAAGLALRTVWAVSSTDLGFETASVARLTVAIDQDRWQHPDSARRLFDRIDERLALEPEVGRVARSMGGPLSGLMHRDGYLIGADTATALARLVDPGFFEILGMRVLEGRTFSLTDDLGTAPVTVVNRTFHDRYMKGRHPVGTRMTRCHAPGDCLPETTIVGVVDDVRFDGPDESVAAEVYHVARQDPVFGGEELVLELHGEPAALESTITARIHDVDPDLAVTGYASLEGLRRERLRPRRFLAWLLGAMAAVAAGLAVAGIAGVAALSASSRTRELGIRRALGASPGALTSRLVREGVVVAGAGVAAGLLVTWAFSTTFAAFFETILWGVERYDALTLVLTAMLFFAVAVAATWGPARRAARRDPREVLAEQ